MPVFLFRVFQCLIAGTKLCGELILTSIHLEILPMLPVRHMSQEAGNFSSLDMQEIINELIAEPGSQNA